MDQLIAGSTVAGASIADGLSAGPTFELRSARLAPPADRPGTVARTSLVERVAGHADVPLIAVVAAPGYGKTTFLTQWARHHRSRVAWVSCDDSDNDPAVLLSDLLAALGRIDGAVRTDGEAMTLSAMGVAGAPNFTAALAPLAPARVVIDHVEAVTNPECRNILNEFALRLPPGWQLAMASRHVLPVAVGRLRARGELLEVGPDDLAMDVSEAAQLVAGAQVNLTTPQLDELVTRTEGWPAGLYLAALAIRAGGSHGAAGPAVAWEESAMSGYLRTEFLDRASPDEVSFLTRTSVLDRLSGPLCDAVLERAGSARVLKALADRNLLVVPLDRRKEWFRYHQVLRRFLQAELHRREPATAPVLYGRASEWCRSHDLPECAVRYAQAAGDTSRVARLVLEAAQQMWARGRIATILGWMDWLQTQGALERYPVVAAHGALVLALFGRAAETDRWAAAAERGGSSGGSDVQSALAYMRAMLCRDGVEAMRRDARDSQAGLYSSDPYRATSTMYIGISHLLEDDPQQADPILANAFEDALMVGSPPLAALALAEWCAAAPEHRLDVETLIERAIGMIEDGRLEDYWSSALVYATAARIKAHRGDLGTARQHLNRAARLRPLLTYALPVVSVQALLQMAHGYVALADTGGATAVLEQATAIRRLRPDLGNLWREADELYSQLQRMSTVDDGASSLTAAELRLLPLLSTHLSLGGIAQQLQVSRETVKSQAASIYRKLGVTGRRAAAARADELGL